MNKIKYSRRALSYGGKTVEHKGVHIHHHKESTTIAPYSEYGESRLLNLVIPQEDVIKVAFALIKQCESYEVEKAFKEYLTDKGYIALLWHTDDVKDMRKDLTDEQCTDVLRMVKKQHDATQGVSWDTIKMTADTMFPQPDTQNDQE